MQLKRNLIKWFLICFSLFWLPYSSSIMANDTTLSNAITPAISKPTNLKTNITPHQSPKLEPVSLQLKWLNQFQFAGYYAAKFKGFYQDEGLDVTIKERDTFVNNIQQVIDGDSEYGIADSMLFLYLSKKAPLSIIAPIFQHSPQVFITLKSSGIDNLYDLEGKNIAFYHKDTGGFALLAMLHENNVEPNLDRVMIKTGPEMLLNGQVDAYPAYLSNEPYFFKEKGVEINIINPINYGVDLYGDMLFTNLDERNNHPDRVDRFRRASIKGWQYALSHKDEIINYMINTLKVDKSYEHLMYEASVIEDVILPNSTPIGTLDKGRLKYIEKQFIKSELINSNLDFSQGIYQKETHQVKFSDKEIAWINAHPTVNVAIDQNWAPIEFVGDEAQHKTEHKAEYKGISNEYLNYLTAFTGIKFIPKTELSWLDSVQKVKAHKLDMFSALISTPERKKYLNFTKPYLKFPMVIATQKGHVYIMDLKNLGNATIAVVKGYASETLIKKHYPNLTIKEVSSPSEGLKAVSKGEALGYVDNIAVISYHIGSTGLSNIQISGEMPFRADISIAIRKDWPELKSIIQKGLDNMDLKTQAKLKNSWLKVNYKKELEWNRLFWIVLPIVLFLLIMLIYNRKLKKLNFKLNESNATLLETQKALEKSNEQLSIISITDFLTGLYNRIHLDKVLKDEIERSNRYQLELSLMIIDLDFFKKINDTYGHLVGDTVLKAMSKSIQQNIRSTDTLGRWGGEEFMLICPETSHEQAIIMANKLLQTAQNIHFEQGFVQTISIGVATYTLNEPDVNFIARADTNLYQAKTLGRNQVYASES